VKIPDAVRKVKNGNGVERKMSMEVNMITTWGIPCGIAEYSKFLSRELDKFEYLNLSN